jgi:LSD1 subclass zinc finger protein
MENNEKAIELFGCTNCGADLSYSPGTTSLKCEYCGTENEIPQIDQEIEELDFEQYLNNKVNQEELVSETYVKCNSCGASSTLPENVTSSSCPYCSAALVIEQAEDEKIIQPKSLLPFKLSRDQSKIEVKTWIKKLWFAPNKLQKAVLNFEHFKGIYIPYWTFDIDTISDYTGQRGKYYYVKSGDKKTRKTKWYPASGNVKKFFDDILTPASKSLPERYIKRLEPWDLENLVPYDKSYLTGFVSEKYQVDLKDGFESAKAIADKEIRKLVRKDIGGDTQRIQHVSTRYNDIKFKHLLLPVYVSSYKYNNKVYQFLVNARTGEIQGERPYSWVKIALFILLITTIIGTLYFFGSKQ